jgi:hypothetical protein
LIEVIAPSLINLDQLVPTKPDINSVTADLQAALVAVGAVQPRVNQSIRQSAPAPQAQQDDYSNPSESQDATPKGSVQDSTAALLERLKRK